MDFEEGKERRGLLKHDGVHLQLCFQSCQQHRRAKREAWSAATEVGMGRRWRSQTWTSGGTSTPIAT
jgi:hypothetical protein